MYANPTQSHDTTKPALLRPVVGVAAAALAVGALAGGTAHAQEVEDAVEHEVEPGDTLAGIAEEYGLDAEDDWRLVFDANPSLDDPDLIVPGQVLQVPPEDADLERRELPAEAAPAPETTAETAEETTSSPAPEPQPATTSGGVWDRLAQCESGGNWAANTGNGYYGGLQFALSSWEWVGGSGYPHEASKGEQIQRAEILLQRQGWSAWPACSSKLGLR